MQRPWGRTGPGRLEEQQGGHGGGEGRKGTWSFTTREVEALEGCGENRHWGARVGVEKTGLVPAQARDGQGLARQRRTQEA